jgi:hypothetical protein
MDTRQREVQENEFDGDAFRKIEGIVLGDQGWSMAYLEMG